VTSETLLAELSRAVEYPRVRKASAWPERRRDELLHRISEQTIVVAPGVEITASRDPDDNRVLEAAIAGQADAIVTGDRDLFRSANSKASRSSRRHGCSRCSSSGDSVSRRRRSA
jgi:putative PIN family toxin of toxin-antitoxin system